MTTDTMAADTIEPATRHGWRLRVRSGLEAHFRQPDGSSRPGVDWLIAMDRDGQTWHARVRACLADDASLATRRDRSYQSSTAMQYLDELLESGWDPEEARDHTIRIGDPLDGRPAPPQRRSPWWRFW